MRLKETVIQTMRQVGKLPLLPFGPTLAAAQRYRGLRFFLPPGKTFVYDHYLGNLKVQIDTTYPIEVEMATGSYDRNSAAILRRFIQPQDVVMDIGANVGALTLLMAQLAHQGQVIAVEPGPTTGARLQQNLALNPDLQQRVTVLAMGLADQAGELYWQEDANVPGNAGLLGTTGDRVPVDTLDHLVAQQQLPRLDFIKIDVEGMEYEVIQGGRTAIAHHRPILYYETLESFRTIRGFDLYGKIYRMLTDWGYHHFSVGAHRSLQAVDNLDVLRSPNTLAVPSEKLARLHPQ